MRKHGAFALAAFFLFSIAPLSFALTTGMAGNADGAYFIYALVAAISVLALAYMAGRAFSIPALQAIVQDELVQVLATGAIALMLLGLQVMVDEHLAGIAAASGASATSMLDAANNKLLAFAANTGSAINGFLDTGNVLGQEASKGVFCNFLGVGFSLANCSPLNAFRGSLTLGTITSSMALADIFAQQYLLAMAGNFAFTLIIPLGLFLRCFKMSRGAGSALIAIGFGFYTVLPTVIVATDNALHGVSPPPIPTSSTLPRFGTCDPKETNVGKALTDFNEYSWQLTSFEMNESIIYYVLVRVIFLSILNLIITLGFIRAFAHILGSEIDVSSLARIS